METRSNNVEKEQMDAVREIDGSLFYHMENLHRISMYTFSRDFDKLSIYIEKQYFYKRVFEETFYKSADTFILRMDITSLSYGQILQMVYQDVQKGAYDQFLLGLKIILVKLRGNQRYAYYDRDMVFSLLDDMEAEFLLKNPFDSKMNIPEIMLEKCENNAPIGFQERTLEAYRSGVTRSLYDVYKKLDEKLFEVEFKTVIEEGIIYHHIVEIDHYINAKDRTTIDEWVFLVKLLSAHYATEKEAWSRDMTTDLLRAYLGIRDRCDDEVFSERLFQLVMGTLKIIIKKMGSTMDRVASGEIQEIINYLINVYMLNSNRQYLVYIHDFFGLLERRDSSLECVGIKKWLEENA